MLLRVELWKWAKKSNLENFESALYSISVSMPLMKSIHSCLLNENMLIVMIKSSFQQFYQMWCPIQSKEPDLLLYVRPQSKQPMEETHCNTVVPDFPELKLRAWLPQRVLWCFFFEPVKPLKILAIKFFKNEKYSTLWECRKPLELGIWSRSSFMPSFVHPACDMKFADTRVWFKVSLNQWHKGT